MTALATRHFAPTHPSRTDTGALTCANYSELRLLPSGSYQTCKGVVIGGAIAPRLPRLTRDCEELQAALLDNRTATPRPLWARVARVLWGAC